MTNLQQIEFFLAEEFADIVSGSTIIEGKIRLFIVDGTYVDLWWSKVFDGRFSFHWQREEGKLYRLDNIPHKSWEKITSFPYHFHDGSSDNVVVNPFDSRPSEAIKDFMKFIRMKLGM